MASRPKFLFDKTIAGVLGLGICATVHAAPVPYSSITFTMYDPTGAVVGTPDTGVTGQYDASSMTFSLASTTPFFGLLWSTHDGKLYAPGTYTISTADILGVTCGASFSICAGDGGAGGPGENVEFVVPPGMVGGHIKFAWGATDGIDVFMIWNSSGVSIDFGTSTPAVSPDGTPGYKMLDGPFKGYSANFDTSLPTTIPVPAAAWLFASGLAGLMGIARRKKAA